VNRLAASDFFVGWGSKSSLRYNSRGHERRDPDIVCGLIVRLIPNAERPECLARKAQPVRAEAVVNLDQDARFRGMAAKDSVHRVLDMPDEVCCVIELKRYFHFIIQMQRRTLR